MELSRPVTGFRRVAVQAAVTVVVVDVVVDVTAVTGFVPAPGGRTSVVGTILSDE
jgi:hypothetical protein